MRLHISPSVISNIPETKKNIDKNKSPFLYIIQDVVN